MQTETFAVEHLAQLEVGEQRRQVWLIWAVVVAFRRDEPRGHITQFWLWLQLVSAEHVVPIKL